MSTAFASVEVRTVSPTLIGTVASIDLCKKSKHCDPRKHVMGGLTNVELNVKPKLALSSAAVASKTAGKIRFYFEPTKIDLSFSWVKVWLAKELKKGSCPYKAVLKHEHIHVNIAHEELRKYAKKLSDSLGKLKVPTKSRPLEIEDSKKSFLETDKKYTTQIQKAVKDEYISKLQAIYNKIGARWKKLDSKSEYQRVRKSCKESDWPW